LHRDNAFMYSTPRSNVSHPLVQSRKASKQKLQQEQGGESREFDIVYTMRTCSSISNAMQCMLLRTRTPLPTHFYFYLFLCFLLSRHDCIPHVPDLYWRMSKSPRARCSGMCIFRSLHVGLGIPPWPTRPRPLTERSPSPLSDPLPVY
jgi:hypothetical protein